MKAVDGAVWCARWLWCHPWTTAKTFWSGFFRIATLLSFAYLIADRIYETSATISVSASDPKNPMTFPFTVTNNSHVFSIINLKWTCAIDSLYADEKEVIARVDIKSSSAIEIAGGQTININCFAYEGKPVFQFKVLPKKFDSGRVRVSISYTAVLEIFGMQLQLFSPNEMAQFTWWGNASNPQWIRGDFAN